VMSDSNGNLTHPDQLEEMNGQEGNVIHQEQVQTFPRELDDEWSNEKIAELVDFDDSPSSPEIVPGDEGLEKNSSPGKNTVSIAELFDDPIQGKTQPVFSKRGTVKASAVGLVMLVMFGGVGLFLNSVFNQKPKKAPTFASYPTSSTTPSPSPQEAETGNLKTQLAIGKQADQIKSLEKSKSPKTNVPNTKKASAAPQPVSSPTRPTSPPHPLKQPTYSSSPRTAPAFSPQYPPPSPTRTVSSTPPAVQERQLTAAAPKIQQPEATATLPQDVGEKPAVDPMQQSIAMNRIGSYGNSNVGEKEPRDVATLGTMPVVRSVSPPQMTNRGVITIPRAVPVVSSTDGAVASVASPGMPFPSTPLPVSSANLSSGETLMSVLSGETSQTLASNQVELTAPQVNPAEEGSIESGKPTRFVQVGTQAQGQLVTPVIWSGNVRDGQKTTDLTSRSTGGEKFIVQLAEPLTDTEGFVALPQGTQIVAAVVSVNESGLAQLLVTQVVVEGQEYVLPPGAISIRGSDGQPLIAEKWGDKKPLIASGDITSFLFGALSKVGQNLTQPDSQSSMSSSGFGFSSSTSTQSGGRNLLGAVLEGGFTPLTQQITERNNQRIQSLAGSPNVWYISAGETVQVFVNQSFEF